MRRKELSQNPPRRARANGAAAAAARLLGVCAGLAQQGEHRLGQLVAGTSPRQWERFPADDAIDSAGLYQWFYHRHSPEDRLGDPDEQAFRALCGEPVRDPKTRHLAAIGLNAKGVPISLFTVNSRVTGDLMLNAA